MKAKSVNHYSVTARPTTDAKSFNDNVARIRLAHNIGKQVFYIDAVMFANKGTKMERQLPIEKLTKGTLLRFDGFFRPKTDKEGKSLANDLEMVITKVSEPEMDESTSDEEEQA